jgi:hypothetical protein
VGLRLLLANQTQNGSLGVWLKGAGRAVSPRIFAAREGFSVRSGEGGVGGGGGEEERPDPLLELGSVGVTRGCTDSK